MDRNKIIARFIALHGVRNTELENLHAGIIPSSKTGDYSDVVVLTPYGEIPWNKLSRISDLEMRVLMLDIEMKIRHVLKTIPILEEQAGSVTNFERLLAEALFVNGGASWDV